MVIWYHACNTSTYDNDACNDKIFMMKNCLDIHNLIIHHLSWFWNRSKRKRELQNCILSFFFTMTKGEIASLYKSRRCKNLIASLPILRSKDCYLAYFKKKNCLLEHHYLEYLKKQNLQFALCNRKQESWAYTRNLSCICFRNFC